MKKAGLLLMSLALSTALWAESPEKKGLDVINRSTAEAHIGFLADDDLEGREAGFRGGRIAGDYIVANLKSLGIDPVGDSYYHPFEAYHLERPGSSPPPAPEVCTTRTRWPLSSRPVFSRSYP